MRARLRDQRGWAVVTSLSVMGLLLAAGLAALAYVDGLQRRSGQDRAAETSFNLTEAVLGNQAFLLSSDWPGDPTQAYPPSCGRASTARGCPSGATIGASFQGTDVNAATTWTVTVRDDLGSTGSYYSRAVLDATSCAGGGAVPCTWDSNRNGQVWVRSQATVAGRTRTLVALVKQQNRAVPLPRNVVIAGKFATNNSGRKVIVDQKGCTAKSKPTDTCNATDPANIAVRCTTTATTPTPSDPCLGYRSEQVTPLVPEQGYVGNVLTPTQLNQLRTYAVQQTTYYTQCPTVAQLTGGVVFVEGVSCSYNGGTANSPQTPGVLIVNRGSLSLGGNFNFYGAIIATNNLTPPADSGWLVSLTGNAYVQGAIFVEGAGGLVTGASGLNLSFDPAALTGLIATAGAAAPVQNSFRELPSGQ